LSGLVVHELRWRDTLDDIAAFRRWLWSKYKINIEDEIHAADMINKPSRVAPLFQVLSKYQRLAVIRNFADAIAALSDISIINVVEQGPEGCGTALTRKKMGLLAEPWGILQPR
jgi:hypothetical protein